MEQQHAIVWIAGEATLRSIWKVPLRDDVGLLEWSGDRLVFKGRRSDAEMPRPTSLALVRARLRWGPLAVLMAVLLLGAALAVGLGGASPWAFGPAIIGFLAGGLGGWYVNRWVRLDFVDHPPVYVIRTDGFRSGPGATPEMMEALRQRYALG
ncbi:MAG: hypothetical protein ACPGQL_10170 [Thermoplasmatota archaeon]